MSATQPLASLSGSQCHLLGICALCAEDNRSTDLRNGLCPRCGYVDPFALEDDKSASSSADDEDDVCPMCEQRVPAADEYGHCSYACASGGGRRVPPSPPIQPTPERIVDGVRIQTLADGRLVLSGNTFTYKDRIKEAALASPSGLAAAWVAAEKSWTVPPGTDISFICDPPPPPPPPPRRTREEWSREEYQNWLARSRKKYFGPCCRFAVCYESRPYGPLCYRCERHGNTINDYTGD